mmetsp:Transcript_21051/g.58815  ORF Transcript_21051/g.58815 Transcript_21051/m.58815 type:complete len:252 (+) Transcript_21051:692-1447(+)
MGDEAVMHVHDGIGWHLFFTGVEDADREPIVLAALQEGHRVLQRILLLLGAEPQSPRRPLQERCAQALQWRRRRRPGVPSATVCRFDEAAYPRLAEVVAAEVQLHQWHPSWGRCQNVRGEGLRGIVPEPVLVQTEDGNVDACGPQVSEQVRDRLGPAESILRQIHRALHGLLGLARPARQPREKRRQARLHELFQDLVCELCATPLHGDAAIGPYKNPVFRPWRGRRSAVSRRRGGRHRANTGRTHTSEPA